VFICCLISSNKSPVSSFVKQNSTCVTIWFGYAIVVLHLWSAILLYCSELKEFVHLSAIAMIDPFNSPVHLEAGVTSIGAFIMFVYHVANESFGSLTFIDLMSYVGAALHLFI